MEQEPDTSGMMSIDPESAQDFTTLYMNKSSATQQETLQQSPLISGLDQMQQWTVPELDVASSSERSTFSSPDALAFATPTFETQESEQSLFELDAFEDLNRMFDWDGACASFVDEASPDCKDTDHSAPTAMQYNTSAFRTISMIREPYAKLQVDPAVYPLNNRFVESGMNVLDHCVTPTSSSSPGAEDEGPSTVCHNCGVTKTPLWRRTPDKRHSLCNACGLYLKQYKTMRPLVPRNRPQVAKKDEVCTNCEATKTSLWRKDENGLVICNACGLYFKLHGKARPVAMRKEKISRRKRYRNLSTERPANTEPILPCAPVTTCAPLQQQGQITVQA
ncbi:GATA zinc finger domain-containing protein [Taphrina deformans PYCC 5710]|uniref:GATA zinc finger domain-containing protein n=1 Tax=Taphrina deformans (strain PYCC 5710 / ATCC 11124 / CBS 356.35 / IMI 108563 / JCM 9778 / NBRC 8474) TaxID=1097556 RepID=R4X853_TAPDE|nr:GATA zinc finger domain-containing protein [Taphrina deformans PYCC 5710]|eukprot:CCG81663.1 GATA zinc finger domain-containing protein [Taphrina deformans PYCC 5710]